MINMNFAVFYDQVFARKEDANKSKLAARMRKFNAILVSSFSVFFGAGAHS